AMADDHVAACARCRQFLQGAGALHRAWRVRPADPVPDLAPAILAAAPALRDRREISPLRLGLGGVGLVLLLVALPTMILHDGGGLAVHHLTRELAAFQAALGVGF